MKAVLLILAALFLSFAWLSPFHTHPWLTFSSELSSFAAALCAFAALSGQYLRIARAQLLALPFVLIPLVQWACGLVFDFSAALISSLYLFGFWCMVVAGYNLAIDPVQREKIFTAFSALLVCVGVITSFIAMCQWLNVESHLPWVMPLKTDRAYANFAQPNNMATFLLMGLMGLLYLYESRKLKLVFIFPIALLLMFAIALSQSRTPYVASLFILLYWGVKQFKQPKRLSFLQMLGGVVFFFALSIWCVPQLTSLMHQWMGYENQIVAIHSVAERAGSGHERLGMWMQMIHAIAERPWWGYGWNQTSVAEISTMTVNTVPIWFASAHNLLLDLLVWNGIPLATLLLLYLLGWLYWLNQNAREPISIFALLMVSAVLIHALLEYPQRYAYFLLPCGFLLGLIQAQTPQLKGGVVGHRSVPMIVVLGVIVLALIWRDYKVFQANNPLVHQNKPATAEVLGSHKIILLTQFEQRLQWNGLEPTARLTDNQREAFAKMVSNKPTQYNLTKYIQFLIANGELNEAQRMLDIMNRLYKQDETLQSLHPTQ